MRTELPFAPIIGEQWLAWKDLFPAYRQAASRTPPSLESRPWGWIAAAVVLLVAVAVDTIRLFSHPSPALTEKDTLVIADFANSTGDPVFDGTLRQGLSVQLEQSPFLRRQVAQLRVGRMFIAGDAAHIRSPFGGRG